MALFAIYVTWKPMNGLDKSVIGRPLHELLQSAESGPIDPKTFQDSKATVVGRFVDVSHGRRFKSKSHSVPCWWDRHVFDHDGIGLPVSRSVMKNTEEKNSIKYMAEGYFCSLNCALAYAQQSFDQTDLMRINEYIREIIRDSCAEKKVELPFDARPLPAPHFSLLKLFGGIYSIEQFRQAHCSNVLTLTTRQLDVLIPVGWIVYHVSMKDTFRYSWQSESKAAFEARKKRKAPEPEAQRMQPKRKYKRAPPKRAQGQVSATSARRSKQHPPKKSDSGTKAASAMTPAAAPIPITPVTAATLTAMRRMNMPIPPAAYQHQPSGIPSVQRVLAIKKKTTG